MARPKGPPCKAVMLRLPDAWYRELEDIQNARREEYRATYGTSGPTYTVQALMRQIIGAWLAKASQNTPL